jgi:hypothetical protein
MLLKVEKDNLFLHIDLAISMVQANIKNQTELTIYSIISTYLDKYISIAGIYNTYTVTDQKFYDHVYIDGFCKATEVTDDPFTDNCFEFSVGEYTNTFKKIDPSKKLAFRLDILEIDPPSSKPFYVRASEFKAFHTVKGLPINHHTFYSFYKRQFEFFLNELITKDFENGASEALLRNYYYSELLTVFGESYLDSLEKGIELAANELEEEVAYRQMKEEAMWSMKNAIDEEEPEIKSQPVVSVRDIFSEDDIPDLLYLALSLFEQAWKDLPSDMNKPNKTQLTKLLKEMDVTEQKTIDSLIKVSTPNNIILGGRAKLNLKDWKPMSKR